MIVEGWDLHVYCMHEERHGGNLNASSAQYGGVNKGDAWQQAYRDGWRRFGTGVDQDVICPQCRKAKKKEG